MDSVAHMMKTAAVALTVLALLAGSCSSDSDDSGDSTDSGDSNEATTTNSSAATDDGSTSLEAPTIVDAAGDVTVQVGGFVVVGTPNATDVQTDDPSVLEVSQAYSDGQAEFNAGAEALSAGSATMSVYEGDELLYEVNVTVEG